MIGSQGLPGISVPQGKDANGILLRHRSKQAMSEISAASQRSLGQGICPCRHHLSSGLRCFCCMRVPCACLARKRKKYQQVSGFATHDHSLCAGEFCSSSCAQQGLSSFVQNSFLSVFGKAVRRLLPVAYTHFLSELTRKSPKVFFMSYFVFAYASSQDFTTDENCASSPPATRLMWSPTILVYPGVTSKQNHTMLECEFRKGLGRTRRTMPRMMSDRFVCSRPKARGTV